jgi:hypothetical protein
MFPLLLSFFLFTGSFILPLSTFLVLILSNHFIHPHSSHLGRLLGANRGLTICELVLLAQCIHLLGSIWNERAECEAVGALQAPVNSTLWVRECLNFNRSSRES